MKFSAQEEYGLRCLIRIGHYYYLDRGITIPEISRVEGIAEHSVAKILRVLRIGGFLESERGHTGGYTLVKPPSEINIGEVLTVLGGKLFDDNYCEIKAGDQKHCVHSIDCSVKSVWQLVQGAVDNVVSKLYLSDLLVPSIQLEHVDSGVKSAS